MSIRGNPVNVTLIITDVQMNLCINYVISVGNDSLFFKHVMYKCMAGFLTHHLSHTPCCAQMGA